MATRPCPFLPLDARLARGQGASLSVRDEWRARATASSGTADAGAAFYEHRATGAQQWSPPPGFLRRRRLRPRGAATDERPAALLARCGLVPASGATLDVLAALEPDADEVDATPLHNALARVLRAVRATGCRGGRLVEDWAAATAAHGHALPLLVAGVLQGARAPPATAMLAAALLRRLAAFEGGLDAVRWLATSAALKRCAVGLQSAVRGRKDACSRRGGQCAAAVESVDWPMLGLWLRLLFTILTAQARGGFGMCDCEAQEDDTAQDPSAVDGEDEAAVVLLQLITGDRAHARVGVSMGAGVSAAVGLLGLMHLRWIGRKDDLHQRLSSSLRAIGAALRAASASVDSGDDRSGEGGFARGSVLGSALVAAVLELSQSHAGLCPALDEDVGVEEEGAFSEGDSDAADDAADSEAVIAEADFEADAAESARDRPLVLRGVLVLAAHLVGSSYPVSGSPSPRLGLYTSDAHVLVGAALREVADLPPECGSGEVAAGSLAGPPLRAAWLELVVALVHSPLWLGAGLHRAFGAPLAALAAVLTGGGDASCDVLVSGAAAALLRALAEVDTGLADI